MADYAYLLRTGTDVTVAYDRHFCGLFPRETWFRLIGAAGLEAGSVALHGADWAVEAFTGVAPG